MKKKEIIIGARGSLLSVCQTEGVMRLLKQKSDGYRFVFKKIATLGDRVKQWGRDDTGIFVKELEDALSSGLIDMAVHSVKDLPSQIQPDFTLAAITKRIDARDMLIVRKRNTGIMGLASGAIVGTTSLRRKAQLLHLRPDLDVQDLRGNLDTRIRKLNAGFYDAIIVAGAGLSRLGFTGLAARAITVTEMLPACGQGALGIEIRAGDNRTERLVRTIDHPLTRKAVSAERSFLHHTQAGCRMPVAAYATVQRGAIVLTGMVISLDGTRVVRMRKCGRDAQQIGRRLAERVLAGGGKKILEEIHRGQE